MDRLACVDVPALPLQLLYRQHPEWARQPAAVVDKDKPQGVILWANEDARRVGILPGFRYAAALSLSSELRAAEVSAAAIEGCVHELTERLRQFTPGVEPCTDEPGVFWLDAAGLSKLYPSLERWGEQIRRALHAQRLHAVVVVGFTRFGCLAVAKSNPKRKVVVFTEPTLEEKTAREVPLSCVDLDPNARDALHKLAIKTVGQFLTLPHAGIIRRFGRRAHRLHRLASGALWAPLQPVPAEEPTERSIDVDDPNANVESLMFLVKQLLDPLLVMLAARGEALSELILSLDLDREEDQRESLRPAEPTLDSVILLGLVRLRLEAMRLEAGAIRIGVTATGTPATKEQLRLFSNKPRRDLRAADRAIARVRAAFGNESVVRAKLRDGHLPEARFSWESIDHLDPANPKDVSVRPLVRRILSRPTPLPSRPAREPDGWLLNGLQSGPVDRLDGPYQISGGWWRSEIERDYYFAELRSGELLWVYYDRRRRRWFLQGQVT